MGEYHWGHGEIVADHEVADEAADNTGHEIIEDIVDGVGAYHTANEDNRGFSAANNQAILFASGEYVLLLNPDTRILDRAIEKMLSYLDKNEETGAVSCKLLNGDGTLQKSVGNFYSFWTTLLENRIIPKILPDSKFLAKRLVAFWDHTSEREIDWARGAVLLVRKSVVEQIGLLDEQFYIYGEEIDWCWRIKKAGWKIMYQPDAEIIHFGKASSSQRHIEMFIQNYKSFYILLKKHYPVYSYWLYRIRTMLYLFLWLSKYSFLLLFHSKNSRKRNEGKQGIKVYIESLKWHFSRRSKIIIADRVPENYLNN